MTEWDPREEMGTDSYFQFKLGAWTPVDTVPEWVEDAAWQYREGYTEEYGERPYHQKTVFVGDSLKYKVEFDPAFGGGIEHNYRVRIKENPLRRLLARLSG